MPRLRSTSRSEWDLKSSFRSEAEEYCQSDYYYAKNDAVVDKRHQAAVSEVAQEERDDDGAQDSAQSGPHQEGRFHIGRDAAMFVDVPEFLRNRGGNGGR